MNTYRKIAMTLAFLIMGMSAKAIQANPKADASAMTICGNARFTVLTPEMIRMEWSEDGVFEDRATLAIINRKLPVPAYTVTEKNGHTIIKTEAVTLDYAGGGKFTADNLSVSFKMGKQNVTWVPGASDKGNLLGTMRTLDGCSGFKQPSHKTKELGKGILSRDGWAIVDESQRHILVPDNSDWGEWVSERPAGDRQDLYIFAYGHQYTKALKDFTLVAGNIPLPPKYTFGYWWSRYWIYTSEEILELAKDMKNHGIPMDVFIIDMDWHETWKEMDAELGRDVFNQRHGWTGYTWNKKLIPDPEALLKELHEMGYKTALNLHPASGLCPYEEPYESFRADYLSRTTDYDGPEGYVYGEGGYQYAGNDAPCGEAGKDAPVPFRMSQQEWADAYFNSVIRPLEKQGVDFWWLDWQQWMESKYMKNLSNTFWLNYTFFNDKVRQSKDLGLDADRPLIYHRWGELGSHRYQLGFSGDTYDDWSTLQFLPYFTATASNVGYGYWGHDIGGHMQHKSTKGPTDPEKYTRWIQYGVFTPIFKTHSTQSAFLERKFWTYPTHYEYLKDAVLLRYELSPYIYDCARQTYDTGVSMCRPLYYVYPEEDKAYTWNEEFFFGDNILATALCEPADTTTGLTRRTMWFPEGNDWYDMAHHELIKGGQEKTLYYAINENPWYIKSAGIVPLAKKGIMSLSEKSNEIRILIAPGKGECSHVWYEDDGVSQHYANDYTTTLITHKSNGKNHDLKIAAREGSYKGMPSKRKITIIFEGITSEKKVKVTGINDIFESHVEGTSLVVELPATAASSAITVKL